MASLLKTLILNVVLMSSVSASGLGEKVDMTSALNNEIQMLEARLSNVVRTVADVSDLTITVRQIQEFYHEQEVTDVTANVATVGQDQAMALQLVDMNVSGYAHNTPLRKAERTIEAIPEILNNPVVHQDYYKQTKVKEAYAILKQIHQKKTMIRLAQVGR